MVLSYITRNKEMETASWNILDCSVRLCRCDLDSYERAAQAQRGFLVEPCNPATQTDLHATNHVQDYNELPVAAIKTESNAEDTVTTRGPAAGCACLQEDSEADIDSLVKEGEDSIAETEVEIGEVIVKQELDVGPTVLQPQSAPRSPLPPAQVASLISLDLNRGTSYGSGLASASHCAIPDRSALQIKVEDDSYEGDSGVPSDVSFILDAKRTGNSCRRVIREHSCGTSEDTSVGAREKTHGGYCFRLPTGYGCKTDCFRAEADTCIGEKQHECDYCKYNTRKKSDMINHIRTHTGEKPYKCERCEYSASRSQHLKTHMRTHTGDKPYKCERCGYCSSRLDSLKIHVRTHTGDKPYKCEQCDYNASHISQLKIHMRIHTGERPYKCDRCDYNASQLGHLKRHTLTHTGVKPYKCERCEYSALHVSHLKLHMRTHTGEKPYKCERCEYRASNVSHLKIHIRTHTGEKPYKCQRCEYSASRLEHLKMHTHVHTGDKPFKCEQCEYSACRRSAVARHVLRRHAYAK